MRIQILSLQVWQRSSRGSRWTMRMATPGTRTGSNSFFSNIHVIHVYMSIFQWESEFLDYNGDKRNIEGPGEQREWRPQGPGQGVIQFLKNACDTCLYANFSWRIRILRLQGWQKPCWGSRWIMRTATPGIGSSSFFQIFMWYMFICQFFNKNPNFQTTTPGTRIGSSSFFSNMHLIHDYMPIF